VRARWLIGQLVVWGVGAVALRVAVVPAERCPRVSAMQIRAAVDAGAAWLTRGQGADGRFVYGYDRRRHAVSSLYNSARHAGVMDALYRTGHGPAADAGLAYVRRNLVRHDGWAAFAGPGENASAGANGLLVVALVHRRERTGETRDDALIHAVARFLWAQTQDDGSVLLEWSHASGRAVPGRRGLFATAEVINAYSQVARTFPVDGWDRRAHRVGA
jgi:hypothetical protein